MAYRPEVLDVGAGGTGLAVAGTSGNVLTSNGTIWSSSSPALGNWVKLQTLTASTSATLTFTSTYITSTYSSYVVIMNAIVSDGTSGAFGMTVSTNNGSSYLSTGYVGSAMYLVYNTAVGAFTAVTSTSDFNILVGSDTGENNGTLWLYNLATTKSPSILGDFWAKSLYWQKAIGYNTTTTAINNIKFAFDAGNIASGNLTLYGIT